MKWNVLPGPSSAPSDRSEGLSTQIRPPIISTSRALMDRPRPVPPYLRVVEASAWENASKIWLCLSFETPMPVSVTAKWSCISSLSSDSFVTSTATLPAGVNLMALPTRLKIICRRRPASPNRASGTSCCTSQDSSRPFSLPTAPRLCTAALTLSRSPKSTGSISSRPALILEKSRTSLITASSDSADDLTISRYSPCSPERSVSRRKLRHSHDTFIGVRTSWLIVARNALLARSAASASSLAPRSASSTLLRCA